MTFWEAFELAFATRIRIRRAGWMDRWLDFRGWWALTIVNRRTGVQAAPRWVIAGDLGVDDYKASDWTTDDIPPLVAHYGPPIPVTIAIRQATGTAQKYGYQSYALRDGKSVFFLQKDLYVQQTLHQHGSATVGVDYYLFSRDDALIIPQGKWVTNSKTGIETSLSPEGQSGTVHITRSHTPNGYDEDGTRTWVNGLYTITGNYHGAWDYTAMPDWAIFSPPDWEDTGSTTTDSVAQHSISSYDKWGGALHQTTPVADYTGGSDYVSNTVTALSVEFTDALLLSIALEAIGGFAAVGGNKVAAAIQDFVGIYPRFTVTAGRVQFAAAIPSFDGIGHYLFSWSLVDSAGRATAMEAVVIPAAGDTTAATPWIDILPPGLGVWTIKDPYAQWSPYASPEG